MLWYAVGLVVAFAAGMCFAFLFIGPRRA